jgi:hypothetical protein
MNVKDRFKIYSLIFYKQLKIKLLLIISLKLILICMPKNIGKFLLI